MTMEKSMAALRGFIEVEKAKLQQATEDAERFEDELNDIERDLWGEWGDWAKMNDTVNANATKENDLEIKLYLLEEEEKKQQKILRALQDILDQDHEKNVAAKLFAQKCERRVIRQNAAVRETEIKADEKKEELRKVRMKVMIVYMDNVEKDMLEAGAGAA